MFLYHLTHPQASTGQPALPAACNEMQISSIQRALTAHNHPPHVSHTASEGQPQPIQHKQSSWLPANLSMLDDTLSGNANDSANQGGQSAIFAGSEISSLLQQTQGNNPESAANLNAVAAILHQQMTGNSIATIPTMDIMPGVAPSLHIAALNAAAQSCVPQVALQLPQINGKNMTLPGGAVIALPDGTHCQQTGPIILQIPQTQHVTSTQANHAYASTHAAGITLNTLTAILSANPPALQAVKDFLNVAAVAIVRAEGKAVDASALPEDSHVHATVETVLHLLAPVLRASDPRRAVQEALAAPSMAAVPHAMQQQGMSSLLKLLQGKMTTAAPATPSKAGEPLSVVRPRKKARGRPRKNAVSIAGMGNPTLLARALPLGIVAAMQKSSGVGQQGLGALQGLPAAVPLPLAAVQQASGALQGSSAAGPQTMPPSSSTMPPSSSAMPPSSSTMQQPSGADPPQRGVVDINSNGEAIVHVEAITMVQDAEHGWLTSTSRGRGVGTCELLLLAVHGTLCAGTCSHRVECVYMQLHMTSSNRRQAGHRSL